MKIVEEKIRVDVLKEFIVYISRNKKSWKIIDELYYKYYDECVSVEDGVKETIKNHNINLKSETIESTCRINRLIALMILDEYAQSKDNLITVLKTAFNKSYKYAISNTTIKLTSFLRRKINFQDSIDNIFSEYLAMLMTARIYGKKIDEDDEGYISLMNTLYELDNIYNGSLKTFFSYKNCTKSRKSVIDKLELTMRGKFYENGYNVEGLHDFLEVKGCFDGLDNRDLQINKTKDDIFCKMYCAIEYTDNIVNKVNSGTLLNDIEIKKETIKDFINSYLVLDGYNEDSIIEIKDINLEELATYMAICLMQTLYIESYNNTSKFFLKTLMILLM